MIEKNISTPIKYEAYSNGYVEENGSRLELSRRLYLEDRRVNLQPYLEMSLEDIEMQLEKNAQMEKDILEKLKESSIEWDQYALQTQILLRAAEYKRICPSDHTKNQWRTDLGYYYKEEISNPVYRMWFQYYEHKKYNKEKDCLETVKWEITWNLSTNSPKEGNTIIAGQRNKGFSTKEAMDKYMAGRIKAYQSYFEKANPLVPKELVQFFSLYNQLLPGYEMEEIEQNL